MKLTVPELGIEEVQAVKNVLESGNLTQGPVAREFEETVANYVGAPYGIATSSCTTALHLCLAALSIKRGQEVIIPDFTFPATANVVVQQGATPVIVDVNPETFTLDPKALKSAITERTAAIMPVHAFGVCADMHEINSIAGAIPVIEDAACALGSTYRGKFAGSLGSMAAFSFHPRKVITTGEGGMVTLNDSELADRLRLLSTHGGQRIELFLEFVEAGFNYRMSDINAAIGLVQMTRLNSIIERRRALARYYTELLGGNSNITVQKVPEETTTTYQSFVVIIASHVNRDDLIRALRARDIEATLGTYSLHNQPVFRERYGYMQGEFPCSDDVYRRSLTLPLYPSMTKSNVDEVCDSLFEIIAQIS